MNLKNEIIKIKQHIKDPLYKNSYFLMLQTVTGAGAGLIFWVFAARFYSENAIGLSSAIISAMNLLVILSILGFNIGIITYLPHEQEKNKMINSCLFIVGIASFILTIIFILGIDIWSSALSVLKEPRYLGLFVFFTIATSMAQMQSHIFVAFRKAKYSFIQSLLRTSRILLLPLLIAMNIFGIFFSYGLGIVIAFIIGNILISRVYPKYRPKPCIDKKMIKNMFHFSFGNYIAGLFQYLPTVILPLMVINVLGAEINAYFYIAWTFSAILLMIPRAVTTSLFAEGSHAPNKIKANTMRAAKFIFLLIIFLIIGIFLFGNYMLLIFGETYSKNAFELLIILALTSFPISINALYITIKRVQKQVMPIIYIYAFVTIFSIVAGYVLVQNMGLIGIGIAWLCANVIGSVGVGIAIVKGRRLRNGFRFYYFTF